MIVAVAAMSEARNATMTGPARRSGGRMAVIITWLVTTKKAEKIPFSMAIAMMAAMKGLPAIL
jgi:hypothetical protein